MLLLLACTTPEPPSDDRIDVTVEQEGGTYVVSWTTPAVADGEVDYGVNSLDAVAAESGTGTDHAVQLAGLAPGQTYSLQATSTDGDSVWSSDIVSFTTGAAPSGLPSTTIGDAEETGDGGGYELVPLLGGETQDLAIVDRAGEFVWWREGIVFATWRASYDEVDQRVRWVEANAGLPGSVLVTSTLDGTEERVQTDPALHHDFTLLPNGDWLAIAYDDQTIQNQVVRGDKLVELAPDGSVVRVLWSVWDHFTYDGTGAMTNVNGETEWPHANSLSYDPQTGKVWVSLWCIDAVVQIDFTSGKQDWQMGGDGSDWTAVNGFFHNQHAPVPLDGGTKMLITDDGDESDGSVPVGAFAVYDLDPTTMTATRLWSYNDGGLHGGMLLGNAERLTDGSYELNWGSGGRLQNVSDGGRLRWQLDFGLGTALGFGEHIEQLGDAAN